MSEREGIPIYQRLRMQLYKDISSGRLKVGEMIPSELSLMETFNVSRTTVRKAIASLVKEGIIERRRGSGSFVKKDIAQAKVTLKGSFGDIFAVVQSTTTRVIHFEYITPPNDVADLLGLTEKDQVLRIERIRLMDEDPFLYSVNYVPDDIGQFLTKKDLEQSALLELIPAKSNVPVIKAVQNFGAAIATTKLSEILGIPMGFPLLEIERVTMTTNDKPINLFYGYFRSDVYKFTTEFSI